VATTRILDRARILAGIFRVAYIISAAMPGVLPRAPLYVTQGRLRLDLPPDLEGLLGGDRIANRVKALGKLVGREPEVRVVEMLEAAE
jgi:exopolyphosphatase/guanosine-5'-triphosphate,3'-diphosphate pyrophosphatase